MDARGMTRGQFDGLADIFDESSVGRAWVESGREDCHVTDV
jgi:hypothetical protein